MNIQPITEKHYADLMNIWHNSKLYGKNGPFSRYERLQYTLKHYMIMHPDHSRASVYKHLTRASLL